MEQQPKKKEKQPVSLEQWKDTHAPNPEHMMKRMKREKAPPITAEEFARARERKSGKERRASDNSEAPAKHMAPHAEGKEHVRAWRRVQWRLEHHIAPEVSDTEVDALMDLERRREDKEWPFSN